MADVKRSLRLFFAREFERWEGLVGFFRRLRRRWVGLFGGERTTPRAETDARRSPRTRLRLLRRRSGRRDRVEPRRPLLAHRRRGGIRGVFEALGSTALSLLLHAVVIALLVLLVVPRPEEPGAGGTEHIVSIRLLPPPRPIPNLVAPKPPPLVVPRPDPVTAPEAGTEDATALPAASTTEPASLEPSGGDPASRARDLLSPVLPLPLGVGSGKRAPATAGPATTFAGRGAGKDAALARYGGSPETEGAVALGLRWLADHQDVDGGWSAEGFQRHCRGQVPCAGRGLAEFDVGVSSLAILAFLGVGALPWGAPPLSGADRGGPEGEGASGREAWAGAARRGLAWLVSRQRGEGAFGIVGDNYLYDHALATFAMAEAYALTGNEAYRECAEAAVRFTVHAQQSGGGWDYIPRTTGRNDLSITGWQVMALRSALDARIEVPSGTMDGIRRFLKVAVLPNGEGIYADQGQEKGRRGINMVAVGLLSNLYMGAMPTDGPVRAAVARLLKTPPDPDAMDRWDTTFQSYYYWYTATLALFHYGGEEWKAWNVFLLRELLPLQSHRSHEEGSWPPERNWVGISGGRVYATAINVLTLETYYRYEPLCESRRRGS